MDGLGEFLSGGDFAKRWFGGKFCGDWGVLRKNYLGERGGGFGGIGQYWILDVLLLFRYPFSGFQILNRNKIGAFVSFVVFFGVIVAVRVNLATGGTKLGDIGTYGKWGF
ncbi:MAG: hypothetical protein IJ635_00740 [Bacteroidaceae bacterium]|nr:hypothetical protein [Bacteroidaceae bacterium]